MEGPTRMEFWDGPQRGFLMPSVTVAEQTAIWDAVAAYIQDQLLSNKGVRIPTLGSFDAVRSQVRVGDEDVTIHRPKFHLARNLVVGHNLIDDKSYLPGNKELEPIKYSKVAAAAAVSRRKVEGCVQGTLSLFSYCLGQGENVALLLKDLGALLLEGSKVEMRFYHRFLEALAGKERLEKVVFQVPQVLDSMLSPMVPMASLCSSGRVIVFPRFAVEVVAKKHPRDLLKDPRRVPVEHKEMRNESFPPLIQGKRGLFPNFPLPGSPNLAVAETSRIWEATGNEKKRRTSQSRKPPVVREVSSVPSCSSRKPSVIRKVSSVPSKESMVQKVSSIPSGPSRKGSVNQKVSSVPLTPSKKPSKNQKVSSIPSKELMNQKVSSIPSSPSKKPSMNQKVSSIPSKELMNQKVSSVPLPPSKKPLMNQKVSSIPSKKLMNQKVSSIPSKELMNQKVSSIPSKELMNQKVSSIPSKELMNQKVSSIPSKELMNQKVSSIPSKELMNQKVSSIPSKELMNQKVSSIPSKELMNQKVSSIPSKELMNQKVSSIPSKELMNQKVSSIPSKALMNQKVSSVPSPPPKKPLMNQKVSSTKKLLMSLKLNAKSRGRNSGRGKPPSLMGEAGEGPGLVERFLAEMAAAKRMTMKPERRRPRGPPAFVTPVVAVLSAASSESSLLEVPNAMAPPTVSPPRP